ncbi:hypothetical protein FACS1894180_6070 [Bacteroidia bacterium]|nr:hypothetical protein FACS1894180_6070 [Bacteroidia bacterium]
MCAAGMHGQIVGVGINPSNNAVQVTPTPNFSGGSGSGMMQSNWQVFNLALHSDYNNPLLREGHPVYEMPVSATVNEHGGTDVSIPLSMPDAGNAMIPQLSLHYNSMASDEMFCNDWGLSGLSSIRRVRKTVYYDGINRGANDDEPIDGTEAFALNGMRMTVVENNFPNTVSYQTETGNIKITAHIAQRQSNGVTASVFSHFTVRYPNGTVAVFGFEDLAENKSQYRFPITKISDRLGNHIFYSYIFENSVYHISHIRFGKNQEAQVNFVYEPIAITYRQKHAILRTSNYQMEDQLIDGEAITTDFILTRIRITHNELPFRDYNLQYFTNGKYIFLSSVSESRLKPEYVADADESVNDNVVTSRDNMLDMIPYAYNTNEQIDCSLPVRFEYGQGGQQESFQKTTALLAGIKSTIYNNLPLKSIKAKFGAGYTTGLVVFPDKPTSGDGAYTGNETIIVKPDLNLLTAHTMTTGAGFAAIMCVDLDNRTGNEIIKINETAAATVFTVYEITASGTLAVKYTRTVADPVTVNGYTLSNGLQQKKYFAGDFDGDGKNEIFMYAYTQEAMEEGNWLAPVGQIIDLANNQLMYKDFIPEYWSGDDVVNRPMATPGLPPLPPGIEIEPGRPWELDFGKLIIHAADFDGDGKTEIYFAADRFSACILNFESSGQNSLALRRKKCSGALPNRENYGEYIPCDINGDGRTDLYRKGSKSFFLYGQNGFTEKQFDNINTAGIVSTDDMNGDGQSDLTFVTPTKITAYFFSEGELVSTEENQTGIDPTYALATGNLLGEALESNELVFVKNNEMVRVRFEMDLSKELLLTGVKNGFGTETRLEYKKLNQTDYTADIEAAFPYQHLNPNATVVTQMTVNNQNQIIAQTDYGYKNGVIHRQGLGFCGFEQITVTDLINSQTLTQTFEPMNFGLLKTGDSPTASIANVYSVNILPNKIAKITLSSSSQTDKLTDVTVNKSYLYDNFGNTTKETVDFGGGIRQITDNIWNNFETSTLYRLGEPASSTTTSYKSANNFVTTRTVLQYNSKGLPVNKKTYYNNSQVSEQTGNYTDTGELLSLGVKTYGATAALSKTFNHDAYGRVTRETDPTGNTVEYFYNEQTGLLERTKDIYGKLTEYRYDNFGRLIKTVSPLGSEKTVEYTWENSIFPTETDTPQVPAAAFYAVKTSTLSADSTVLEPETVVYFDALSRDIRTEQIRFDNSRLKTDKEYDGRGRLLKVSLPFKGTAPVLWNKYHYDNFNRPTAISYASGRQDNWSYSGNSITTTEDGIATTKTFNAAGQLTGVTDSNGGTIVYSYRPDGQAESTVTNGITTSFTYDTYGRQLTITDPSAGTETVTYDTKGNVATHKDANNKLTTFVYDAYNRLTRRQMPEYTTEYSYDGRGNLHRTAANNDASVIEYSFDTYGRLISEAESWQTSSVRKSYIYTGDLLSRTDYDVDKRRVASENYSYQNGCHTQTMLADGTAVWRLTAENDLGQVVQATTGNLKRSYGFNKYGMPTARKIQIGKKTVIQNFTYEFESKTGNLLARTDNSRDLTETFKYDILNRLIGFDGKQVDYFNTGNIKEKTDMGVYMYNTPDKPYAVSDIMQHSDTDASLIPATPYDKILYTSFKRPSAIYYGENRDSKAMFEYNGNSDRVQMTVVDATTGEWKKNYLNNCYEKTETLAGTKEILYLCGDYYTSHVVMVRENSSTWQPYYIGRDYLGSITHVISAGGAVQQELSYDAWGNLRDPKNHDLLSQDHQPDLFLGRGYTGHEHLAFCGLINMNARLYEPAVGRFLSPDPYIQDATNTQNYNRYSYCLNNPLKYTDPTGMYVYGNSMYDIYTNSIYRCYLQELSIVNPTKFMRLMDKAGYDYGYGYGSGILEQMMAENDAMINTQDYAEYLEFVFRQTYQSSSTSSSGQTGGWNFGEWIRPGYVYYNSSTGQVGGLVPNLALTAYFYAINPTTKMQEIAFRMRMAAKFSPSGYPMSDGPLNNVSPEFHVLSLGRFLYARLGVAAVTGGYAFSRRAAQHMAEPGRTVPVQIINDAIKTTKGLPDPLDSRALMHYSPMWKNGTQYNLEILYDQASNSIWHFKYTQDALGILPAIK